MTVVGYVDEQPVEHLILDPGMKHIDKTSGVDAQLTLDKQFDIYVLKFHSMVRLE